MTWVLAALLLAVTIPAHAREADQFTRRPLMLDGLSDSAGGLDVWINLQIQQSLERINREGSARRYAGAQELGAKELVTSIAGAFLDPLLPELHTRVELWVTSPAGRIQVDLDHPGNRGIYRGTSIRQVHWSWFTGVSNTLRIGDALVGVDKLGHFFAQGYQYYMAAQELRSEGLSEALVRSKVRELGHSMELGVMGFKTMAIYSPADLAANWDGWRFWDSLVGGADSYIIQDWSGNWIQVRPFSMEEYARSDWDEVMNPPYAETPELAARMQERVAKTCEKEQQKGVFRSAEKPGDEPRTESDSYRLPESALPPRATRIRFECPMQR